MPRKLAVGFLLVLCLILANHSFLWAEEVEAGTQITNLRYSLAVEKDRLVLDFNRPFTYQVTKGKGDTEISILVDALDKRLLKDYLALKDKTLQKVEFLPAPNDPQKTLVKVYLHYPASVKVWNLKNPERLVIDIQKIFEQKEVSSVAPGIEYQHISAGTLAGPLLIDALQVDLNNPNLEIKPVLALHGQDFTKKTVSTLAAETGALGAINATYFAADGRPLGLIMVEGKIVSPPLSQRTALGITKEHKILMDNVDVQMDALTPQWEGVEHIVSGGPRLVKEGQVFITAEAEKFRSDITQGRAPRSALGVTKEQKLLLVAVTGRQPSRSIGLTLPELAQWMIKLGAVEAMNLDGGGSTALVVGGKLVNSPSDGQERKVGSALVVKPIIGQTVSVQQSAEDKKPEWF